MVFQNCKKNRTFDSGTEGEKGEGSPFLAASQEEDGPDFTGNAKVPGGRSPPVSTSLNEYRQAIMRTQ